MYRFLSIMKLIIFFVYVPFVYSESHTFYTFYTEINGQTVAGIPEISSLTMLDGRQIDFYDSVKKELNPRQDWMKEFLSGDRFTQYIQIRMTIQHTNKVDIAVLMEQFNQSLGVHTYQRIYGCEWDSETQRSRGFDQHGYDGQDYVTLDLKQLRYITAVPQGLITINERNNDTAQLEYLRQYYLLDCVKWLKDFVKLEKEYLDRRAPEVSLLQSDPSSPVSCHATGFYPKAVTMTWLRNGEELDEDVEIEQTVPNEDGSFQKTSTIHIRPDKWKMHQYVCEVEHLGKTIRKILTEDEIKSNINIWHTWYFCVVDQKIKEHPEDSD